MPGQGLSDDGSYDLLLEQAMERVQRQAPWWSHREISDPGVMLLELWTVLCDMQNYYLNQIQESHYRKYLKLLGMKPDEGECARVWVCFNGVTKDCILPRGTKLLADTMVFEIEEDAELTSNRLCGLCRGSDRYKAAGMGLSRKRSFVLERAEILFYLQLVKPVNAGGKLCFHVLLNEKGGRNPSDDGFSLVRLAWEYQTGGGWREAEVAEDETCGLLYSGSVCLRMDRDMAAGKDGNYEIRCRLREGEYDEMPILYKISLNTVRAVQKNTLCCREQGEFTEECREIELRGYLARTGQIRVLRRRETREELWEDITGDCAIDPPITAERRKRTVSYEGGGRVMFLCSAEGVRESYLPCPVTGVAAQRIALPWDNVMRDSVELMLEEGGAYRPYRREDPEEKRYANAWHWQEEENGIILGDGRYGGIPPASEEGLLLTSLALFEGKKGNVSIGRISRLEKPELFPGITCVNLMTGKGGRDRQSPSGQFAEAGSGLRRVNRIVSGEDAAKLAEGTPGLMIKRVEAEWRNGTVVVTVFPAAVLKSPYCEEQYRRRTEQYLEAYRPVGSRIRVEIAKSG